MNENALRELHKRFDNMERTMYPDDVSMDLFQLAKQDLNRLGVKNKQVVEKKKKRLYLYDDGEQILRYTRSFYPNNSMFGFKIANDKMLTEKYLNHADIKTTNSKVFKSSEIEEARKYVVSSDNKLVIKPLSMEGAAGVFIDIHDGNFDYFWKECLDVQKRRQLKVQSVIIQDFIPGFEVRMIITEGKFLSATLRIPAHVKGDGEQSIEQLIEEKNDSRKVNPFLSSQPIKINNKLKKLLEYKGLTLHSVLKKDEFCILFPQSNTQFGGENIEITSFIKESLKEQCEEATRAMPGLNTLGIDLMIESLDDEEGTIIEVNKAPAFLLNYYPYIGKPYQPMEEIFRSFLIESRVLRDKFDVSKADEKELETLLHRYKFNYYKQKSLGNTIRKLEEENAELRRELDSI